MRTMLTAGPAMILAAWVGAGPGAAQTARPAGVALADLTWREAESVLTDSSVVVIPLGAGSLEYGPHIKLGAGEQLARYVASRVQASTAVVIAPPLTYHFFPAYLEYPGSTSLTQPTARDVTADVVRCLARYGPKRFYVINTGGASARPLADAAKMLADDGILLGWTDMRYHLFNARIQRQQRPVDGAPHADEIETSMMLAVDPSLVTMSKAAAEYGRGTGSLTRKDNGTGIYSQTGVLGDPTLATADKGGVLLDTLVAGVLDDIEKLRAAPLPLAKATSPSAPPPARPAGPPVQRRMENGCTPGDERTIRDLGTKFSVLWRQMDFEGIGRLFTPKADIRHPDGTVERTSQVIVENRKALFQKSEYRGSIHPLTVYDVRCLESNHAIADGKWELRFNDTSGTNQGRPPGTVPYYNGLFTLVLTGQDAEWKIEAWRYTVNPPEGTPPPTTLKQPGFIGRGF